MLNARNVNRQHSITGGLHKKENNVGAQPRAHSVPGTVYTFPYRTVQPPLDPSRTVCAYFAKKGCI